jgi:hypothetical protein
MPVRTLALLLLFAACRAAPSEAPEPSARPPQADAGSDAPDRPEPTVADTLRPDEVQADEASFTGTVRTTEKTAARQGVALLQAVRTGRHAGFDRVVFAFDAGALPGYHLEYVDRPVRNCGEGRVVPIEGDAWLQVRLTPANAHTEEGRPTVAPRERRPALPVLREPELTCDFEADVTWVLGLAAPNPYRVLELRYPPRLVVDVRH